MQIAYTFLVIQMAGSNIGVGADIFITMNRVPTLVGIDGAFRGETYPLEHFKTYIVGRSRNADISLRRTQHYRNQSDEQRDADKAAKTVSARHFQITYLNSKSIEIKNPFVNALLGGWQIGSIITWRSGFPINPSAGVNRARASGGRAGASPRPAQRAGGVVRV